MSESPLPKVITFENNQLLCDGEPISIEDAEKLVREQVKAYEDSTADLIKNDTALDVESIEKLADSVNDLRYHTGLKLIPGRGIEEYRSVADDIIKAIALCDKALEIFSSKRKKQHVEFKPKSLFKPEEWPLNINNDPDYDPTLDELYEKYHELIFQDLIYTQFKNQFYNTGAEVEKENIKVFGNMVNEFRLYIVNKNINIYFQINENIGNFGDVTGKFIGSALKVGSISLQNTRDNYLIHGNNNFKTAQTIENLIVKQIRFLKNTIKQEITYSLSQNISKAEERLNVANVFIANYGPLLDKKTMAKLKAIIKDAKKIMKEQNNRKPAGKKAVEPGTKNLPGKTGIENEKILAENEVKKQLLIAFDTTEDKIRFESKQKEEYLLFDALISGQRININIFNFKKVFVSSTNTIGTGKTDFQQVEAPGKDLTESIKNAAYMSSLPVLTRQIDNLSASIKGNEPKKIFKGIENHLKEIIQVNNDFSLDLSDKIKIFIRNFYYIIDKLPGFNKQINEDILNVTDKLLKRVNEFVIESTEININGKAVSLHESNKSLGQIYQSALLEDNDKLEALNIVKKYLNRSVYSNVIIKELNEFKILLFETKNLEKAEKEILRLEAENTIKPLADHLSEDVLIGGIARKILGLLDISISSRDDMFKFNIENIIMEIIKLR
jgi:hypothetical protein